ncbi:hypothetical protein [Ilumatobacter sp.]|uniref:hypothetical protein n=1 Tax=Ilumatobacter sp. TaxID=1967498 RepID=UPI003B522E60
MRLHRRSAVRARLLIPLLVAAGCGGGGDRRLPGDVEVVTGRRRDLENGWGGANHEPTLARRGARSPAATRPAPRVRTCDRPGVDRRWC